MKYIRVSGGFEDERGEFFEELSYRLNGKHIQAPRIVFASVEEEIWIDKGVLHREDGPAMIRYKTNKNERMRYETYAWRGDKIWHRWSE